MNQNLEITIGGNVKLDVAEKELTKFVNEKRQITFTTNVDQILRDIGRIDKALDGLLAKQQRLQRGTR